MVYYGLALYSGNLVPGASYHLNFLVGGLVEIPAYLLTIFIMLYLGRRIPLSLMFFTGGVFLILILTVLNGDVEFKLFLHLLFYSAIFS